MTRLTIIISSQNATQFYRKPHDKEIISYDSGDWRYGGDGYRLGKVRNNAVVNNVGIPEVYALNREQTPLNCDWQRLWRSMNPMLTDGTWSGLMKNHEAWMNNTGVPGRYNCITGEDSNSKFPAFNSAILNGGATIRGTVQGDYLLIENMLNSDPVPTVDTVLQSPWLWYWGTNVKPDGRIGYITKLGQDGDYYPVRVPFITDVPVRVPIEWFHKLPLNITLPDPRWMA